MSNAVLEWIEATTLDDLWEGEMLDFTVKGEQILLVRLQGGTIRAYQGVCPHQQIFLALGELDSEDGEHVLTCGGHGWEFDLMTGAGINPGNCQLYRYEVKLEGKSVFVGIPQDGERHYNRCRQG